MNCSSATPSGVGSASSRAQREIRRPAKAGSRAHESPHPFLVPKLRTSECTLPGRMERSDMPAECPPQDGCGGSQQPPLRGEWVGIRLSRIAIDGEAQVPGRFQSPIFGSKRDPSRMFTQWEKSLAMDAQCATFHDEIACCHDSHPRFRTPFGTALGSETRSREAGCSAGGPNGLPKWRIWPRKGGTRPIRPAPSRSDLIRLNPTNDFRSLRNPNSGETSKRDTPSKPPGCKRQSTRIKPLHVGKHAFPRRQKCDNLAASNCATWREWDKAERHSR
jgi:hypothetical protein